MGMSADFENAVSSNRNLATCGMSKKCFSVQIAAGSTNVRIGSKIFGFRR